MLPCVCCRMREALTYLAHAYDTNVNLLRNGEKRGVDKSLIGVYRRKCLSVSKAAQPGQLEPSLWSLMLLKKKLNPSTWIYIIINLRYIFWVTCEFHNKAIMLFFCSPHVGAEWKRIPAVPQRRGEQGGGGCSHYGRGGHPLSSPDEPRVVFIAGRPRHDGEHPQPLVLLFGPGHGW